MRRTGSCALLHATYALNLFYTTPRTLTLHYTTPRKPQTQLSTTRRKLTECCAYTTLHHANSLNAILNQTNPTHSSHHVHPTATQDDK